MGKSKPHKSSGKAPKKPDPKRRKILPILGGGLLLPMVPASAAKTAAPADTNEEYKTLLKPDGTTVRIKASKLKKSRVVRRNISNSELKGWLKNNKDS